VSREINCFLVDDDADDQEIFLSVLQTLTPAVRCDTAVNGKDALQKLLAMDINPDVIFLDLNMPLMNGKQFLAAMKAHDKLKNIPVIILSTSADQASILETKALGAKQFITKPDKFSLWQNTLTSILRDSSFYVQP
jgi:CheY-like chemotaxis protein